MTVTTPGAAAVAGMAAVLTDVFTRSPRTTAPSGAAGQHRSDLGADQNADIARAAQVLLPAVLALNRLAGRLTHDAAPGTGGRGMGLAGFIHRRCRIIPADTEAPDVRGREPGAGVAVSASAGSSPRAAGDVELARVGRGGWELLQGVAVIHDAGPAWPAGARVTHDLARRTALSPPAVGGRDPAPGPGPTRELTLAAVDLSAWADATGDHNPIHLHPGAALRAGMHVGEEDVVAHGLLLGAISLALVPPARVVNLRFTGAAPLPADGAVALHVDADGGISIGAHTVLTRR